MADQFGLPDTETAWTIQREDKKTTTGNANLERLR